MSHDSQLQHAVVNGPGLWLRHYPWPDAESHKYSRGHVLVLGGETLTGAARLTARGAMRVGAGLVTVAAPSAVWSIYATALTGAVVARFDGLGGFKALLSDARRNVAAIGPGAGVGEATRAYVLAALDRSATPGGAGERAVVLDADALTSFATDPETLFAAITGPCVLTPHEGEFRRLFDLSGDRRDRASAAAALSHAVVVLKGAQTVIAAPDGRGDVLTGFIAGLLAQGLDYFDAACAGVWLHGEAATEFGPGLIAEDLPEMLPAVLRGLRAPSP
jgi:ADP-dependent NAD(P)H-hydrate dehydratase / NAD(P)H-hydrate epimerase